MAEYTNDFIFGRHPVVEALEQGSPVDKVLLLEGTRGELEITLRKLCKSCEVPLVMVPKDKLNRLTKANHQGVIALMTAVPYQRIEDIVPLIFERGETPLILLLDGITDVRNFGAIARSAACSGVHAIVVANKNQAPLNSEAMKTSAGGLLRVPVCRANSLVTVSEYLTECGIRLYATSLESSEYVQKCDLSGPTAIIMGAEDVGVSHALWRKAAQRIRIPQVGNMDSFNVSVATGIVLYEAMRQRMML